MGKLGVLCSFHITHAVFGGGCGTVPSGTHSMSVLIMSRTTDFVPKCSYWEFYHSAKLQQD